MQRSSWAILTCVTVWIMSVFFSALITKETPISALVTVDGRKMNYWKFNLTCPQVFIFAPALADCIRITVHLGMVLSVT